MSDVDVTTRPETARRPLPKLLPAPARESPSRGGAFVLSGEQLRRGARAWHVGNPDFATGVLRQAGIVPDEGPETTTLVAGWLREAAEIGLWSKADMTQYAGACIEGGGSVGRVPSFASVVVQFREECPDVMAQIIAAAPIAYWTYLPSKVERYDRGL